MRAILLPLLATALLPSAAFQENVPRAALEDAADAPVLFEIMHDGGDEEEEAKVQAEVVRLLAAASAKEANRTDSEIRAATAERVRMFAAAAAAAAAKRDGWDLDLDGMPDSEVCPDVARKLQATYYPRTKSFRGHVFRSYCQGNSRQAEPSRV
jgi:hypothetical protein